MKNKQERSSVPALDKAIEVIELLASAPSPLSLVKIAKLCHRSVSEIQRTITSLAEKEYILRNADGDYLIGIKLHQIAQQNNFWHSLAIMAQPSLDRFSAEFNESIHISGWINQRIFVLSQSKGTGFANFALTLGSELPIDQSVSGQIIWAFLSESEKKDYIKCNAGRKPVLTPSREEKILKDECFFATSSVYEGVYDLGVPLLLDKKTVIGALTVNILKKKNLSIEQGILLKNLKKTKKEIEAYFSY